MLKKEKRANFRNSAREQPKAKCVLYYHQIFWHLEKKTKNKNKRQLPNRERPNWTYKLTQIHHHPNRSSLPEKELTIEIAQIIRSSSASTVHPSSTTKTALSSTSVAHPSSPPPPSPSNLPSSLNPSIHLHKPVNSPKSIFTLNRRLILPKSTRSALACKALITAWFRPNWSSP